MFKLQHLMLAMAEYEGWYPSGTPKFTEGSRSFRNHNPGNLRSSIFQVGTKDGFAVFSSDVMGWTAFQYDLTQKAKGKTSTGLNGESTLRQLIFTWAPPSDNNNSEKYLEFVLQMTGFSENMKLKELLL